LVAGAAAAAESTTAAAAESTTAAAVSTVTAAAVSTAVESTAGAADSEPPQEARATIARIANTFFIFFVFGSDEMFVPINTHL
jgi:hypothetical protein